MVYKRYITKNGKKIGPYYYENKKVNGKVVSIYLGTSLPEDKKLGKPKNSKNIFTGKYKYFILGGVVFLLLLALFNFFILVQLRPTGEVSVQLAPGTYEQGDVLSGIVKLTMSKGELIPANTQVLVDNVGDKNRYLLSELLSEYQSEGDFYMNGLALTGSGKGYGIAGEKTTYPEVDFTLEIIKLKNTQEIKQIYEQSNDLSLTANAIAEPARQVKDKVSFENPYTYNLEPGETAKVISSSQPVNVNTKDNILTITTDYSEKEEGFGEDYLLDEKVEFLFNLQQLNLLAKQGDLIISFTYNNEEILSTTQTIDLGEPITDPLEEPIPEPPAFDTRALESLWSQSNVGAGGVIVHNPDNANGPSTGNYADAISKIWANPGNIWTFTMQDSSVGIGTINSVTLNLKHYVLDYFDDEFALEIFDGTSWQTITTWDVRNPLPASDTINSFDVSGILNTWTKINAAQVRLAGITKNSGPDRITWFVDTVRLEVDYSGAANSPPQILSVGPVPSLPPIEDNIQPVTFTVQVRDLDGYTDITSVSADFNLVGEPTRSGSCSLQLGAGTDAAYECIVNMQYYDAAGDWIVTIIVQDSQGSSDTDNTQRFTYQVLKAIVITNPIGALSWPSLIPESTNILSNNHPNTIRNTGNYEGPLFVTAKDLIGETNPLEVIPARNFRSGLIGDLTDCSAIQLRDSESVEILGSSLARGAGATEELYYCIESVPNVSPQTYSATGINSWTIFI